MRTLIDFLLPRMATPEREAYFSQINNERKFRMRRFFLFFGCLAFLAHGALDYYSGGHDWLSMFALRCAAIILMTFVAMLFCLPQFRRETKADLTICIYLAIPALAIIIMTVMAGEGTAADTYPFGLVILFVYGGTVLMPDTRKLALLCSIAFAIFLLSLKFSMISDGALVVNLFFMVFGISGICIGGGFRERLERQQLLQSEAMRELNTDLEVTQAEAVAARDKAIKASKVQNEFIANMSHELRTPLNAIIGFSEVMETEIFGPLGAEQYKSYTADIVWSGKSLLMIVDDLLDTQRIATGKLRCLSERFEVNEMIRHSVMLMTARAKIENITINAPASPLRFDAYGDSFRMSQALVNLLTNAVKFSKSGGIISVTQSFMASGEYRITVTDTGIGIPADDLNRIQQPFQQVEASAFIASENGGLGLGLAIVNGILNCMECRLEIESTVGVGTSCHIFIPSTRLFLDDGHEDSTRDVVESDPADAHYVKTAKVVSLPR